MDEIIWNISGNLQEAIAKDYKESLLEHAKEKTDDFLKELEGTNDYYPSDGCDLSKAIQSEIKHAIHESLKDAMASMEIKDGRDIIFSNGHTWGLNGEFEKTTLRNLIIDHVMYSDNEKSDISSVLRKIADDLDNETT